MSLRSEFENIATVHLGTVYRTAFALCGNKDTAEDMVQTTFLKAFENFSSFKKGTNCKAWLIRILRNTWIDRLRHKRFESKQVRLEEDLIAKQSSRTETAWSDAKDLLENFSDEQVIEALIEIPEDQRLTLYLADVEGFNQEQIAEIMGVVVGTVKSRTSRARNVLKRNLSSYAKEMGLIRDEQ
jgi:RNA polymerase sigma-70 factor (ECF subfamily)